ncbi:7877_t:CDS:2, partial [Diversispora eburnea]
NLYEKRKEWQLQHWKVQKEKATIIEQVWEAGDLEIKIVDTATKTCHQCYAEDHLVFKCPVAEENNNQENILKTILKTLQNIKQGILDIRQYNNDMEERVQALEEYVGKEAFDEVMEDGEDLENIVKEVSNATTEIIRTKEKQVTQIEQIADTVKMLADLILELKQSNVETQKRLERMENMSNLSKQQENIGKDFNATVNPKINRYNTNISKNNRSNKPESSILRFLNRGEIKSRIDYIWISDNLTDQLFYADIISAHLTSQSDHTHAIIEIETNIFEKQKPMLKTTESNEIISKRKFHTFRKGEKSKILHNHFETNRKVVALCKIFNWGWQWYMNKKQRTVMELKINQKIDEIKKEYEIEIVTSS